MVSRLSNKDIVPSANCCVGVNLRCEGFTSLCVSWTWKSAHEQTGDAFWAGCALCNSAVSTVVFVAEYWCCWSATQHASPAHAPGSDCVTVQLRLPTTHWIPQQLQAHMNEEVDAHLNCSSLIWAKYQWLLACNEHRWAICSCSHLCTPHYRPVILEVWMPTVCRYQRTPLYEYCSCSICKTFNSSLPQNCAVSVHKFFLSHVVARWMRSLSSMTLFKCESSQATTWLSSGRI